MPRVVIFFFAAVFYCSCLVFTAQPYLQARGLKDCNRGSKYDFDQRLECAAPKRWSKYTTDIAVTLKPLTIFN